MDADALNEHLAAVQDGDTVDDRFAAVVLTELLREISQSQRAGVELIPWEWESRVRSVAATCGVPSDAESLLWEWCCDISADMAREATDPWVAGT